MRILLIARRFWPLAGGRSRIVTALAEGFAAAGHEVTVVTPQWDSNWPAEIRLERQRIVRLPHSELPVWGVLRSMSALASWLGEHKGEFDVACVSGLAHDAFTAVGSLAEVGEPVVLRCEAAGPTGDCKWQDEATFGWGIRSRCHTAAAFIAPTRAIRDELDAAGYTAAKINIVPNGFPILPALAIEQIAEVRKALGDIDGCHVPPEGAPCVIAISRFDGGHGLADLLQAWREVLSEQPEARLWLLGEGEDRDVLTALANGLGIHPRVCLPGTLDDVRDALRAADVIVRPAHDAGTAAGLAEAMAAGCPLIATDLPGHRTRIDHEVHGLLVPPNDPAALAKAICRLLINGPLATTMGLAAQGRAAKDFSFEAMVSGHLELFGRLLDRQKMDDRKMPK